MKLCVFGASGPVGRAVIGQALEAGHDVTAVTRHPDRYGLSAPRLHVFGGDILNLPQVEAAIRGADAVISVIGVLPSRKPITTSPPSHAPIAPTIWIRPGCWAPTLRWYWLATAQIPASGRPSMGGTASAWPRGG